jgi:antibiotic biosynthesis monooxygenase (ABM) superfamily enzyme
MSATASPQTSGLPASRPLRVAPSRQLPRWERALLLCLMVASVILLALTVAGAPRAHADSVAHLIGTAVNELCPAQIWQLRNSAAHYAPTAE